MNNQQKSAILTGSKMMIAGALAFCIYQNLPWPYGFWAVVTVAAVTRPGLTNTLSKIITRIIGTLIGGFLAYLILATAGDQPLPLIICFFSIIALSSYISLQKSVLNYAGIIIGLTLTIVLSTGLLSNKPFQIMIYRIIDVVIGVSCIAMTNAILRVLFPKKEIVAKTLRELFIQAYQKLVRFRENKNLIRASFATALAASITFLPWLYWRYPGGFWATISCFFIMEESLTQVQQKSWLRFLSHVITAALGGISAIIIGDHIGWLLLPLMVCFFTFGYIMVRSDTFSNAGNTMGIALAIMLLADPGTVTSLHVVVYRFINVVSGIAIGLMVTFFLQKSKS